MSDDENLIDLISSDEETLISPGVDSPQDGLDPQTLVGAINELTKANNRSSRIQLDLVTSVRNESDLRTKKIHSIEATNRSIKRALWGGVIALLLLIALTGVNVYNTTVTSNIARNAQQTNELLVGCFTPGSDCQKQSQAVQEVQQARDRQQSFVIAVCQRTNPTNPDDPIGSTKKLLDCIHQYYPDLTLPPKAG